MGNHFNISIKKTNLKLIFIFIKYFIKFLTFNLLLLNYKYASKNKFSLLFGNFIPLNIS